MNAAFCTLASLNPRATHFHASKSRQCRPLRPCRLAASARMSVSDDPSHSSRINLATIAAACIISVSSLAQLAAPPPANASINSAPLRFSQSLFIDENAPPNLTPHWDVHSVDSSTETFVVFSNDSDQLLDLWWVDYAGQEVYYATISPRTTHMQPSYATHPWVVREHMSQNSILVLVASDQPEMAIVGDL